MMKGRARATLLVVVVAVASALFGAALDHHFNLRRHGRGPLPEGRDRQEQQARRRRQMLDRLTGDLALRPPQRAGIDSIMQRTDSALHGIRMELQPRLQRILDSSRSEVAGRLDSAQRLKFLARRP